MKRILFSFASLLIVSLLFIPGVFAQDSTDKQSERYLVMFDGPAEAGILNAFGVKESDILHEFDLLPVMHLDLSTEQAKGLKNHPQIKFVEEDARAEAFSQTTPWGITRVQAPDAHQMGYSGNGVKVAILDTGIDASHPDLQANVQGGYSVFSDSANNNPFYDGDGHGTHVAGTVAAANNGGGVLGVSHQADLYAVKVLDNNGGGSYSGIAQGIEWSINNDMDIINMSLGGSAHSSILEAYSNLAYNEGILVVAAAGNSGNAWGIGDTVAYPAKYDSVIAVAATDQNNNRASFSSHGPAVELSAPGVNVLSTVPGNGHQSYNGTSMASPHVAGVAALTWQAKPYLSNSQLRQTLQNTALNLGNSNFYGHGLVRSVNAIQN
ncbi:S8 family peptidase [Evansella halocellulosilytica]|uniref:S8 family peptidase n=1 Tax=Evansella halocellulosilytica TaxID=2011013 RepID=UPI000BB86252|nr:S8 family peptidase [Evansella halocellulosilytica]